MYCIHVDCIQYGASYESVCIIGGIDLVEFTIVGKYEEAGCEDVINCMQCMHLIMVIVLDIISNGMNIGS